MFLSKKVLGTIVAVGSLMAVGSANAAGLTLPVELTDALASVATIGAGVFAIAVGVRVYKWARSAL